MKTEHLILSNLIHNSEYMRKVIPFLNRDYFSDSSDSLVYNLINDYVDKYNKAPPIEAVIIDLEGVEGISESVYTNAQNLIKELKPTTNPNIDWLVDTTEKFCQDKALYNAVLRAIKIMDDSNSKEPKTAIPKILQDALAVSFDTKMGHDYFEDAEARFDSYHSEVSRIPFDLELLNKITKGGIPPKTLNIILGGTNVGKSLILCHLATAYLRAGKNVLYITLEMAEEEISKRIDANLLNISLDNILAVEKSVFMKKIEDVRKKTVGKLKVIEYPTASVGANHFRHQLNEYRIKDNFVPDVVIVDYINLCTSSRIKSGSNANSFTIVKAIAEELRGLAVEFKVPFWSATQTTRAGLGNSELELEDVSESIALASTCDFMLGITQTEQMAELNQYSVKQLKSRYGDKNKWRKFFLGVDKDKMRLYDIDEGETDKPIMDNTPFGERSKFSNKFEEFK